MRNWIERHEGLTALLVWGGIMFIAYAITRWVWLPRIYGAILFFSFIFWLQDRWKKWGEGESPSEDKGE